MVLIPLCYTPRYTLARYLFHYATYRLIFSCGAHSTMLHTELYSRTVLTPLCYTPRYTLVRVLTSLGHHNVRTSAAARLLFGSILFSDLIQSCSTSIIVSRATFFIWASSSCFSKSLS